MRALALNYLINLIFSPNSSNQRHKFLQLYHLNSKMGDKDYYKWITKYKFIDATCYSKVKTNEES